MTTQPPRKLSILPHSPNYNKDMLLKIHSVFVDGVHIPECVAYDMDQGWAKGRKDKIWGPKIHGHVTVLMKDDPNLMAIKNEKAIENAGRRD